MRTPILGAQEPKVVQDPDRPLHYFFPGTTLHVIPPTLNSISSER